MNNTGEAGSGRFVDQLLLESGIDDDGDLRPALIQLRALARTAPEPSTAVAALMAGETPGSTDAGPNDELDELGARRRLKRRLALTSLSVAATLAAGGAAAVASDQQLRESLDHFNRAVLSLITGPAGGPPEDQREQPAVPVQPVAPAGPASIPAAPAPVEASAEASQPDDFVGAGATPGPAPAGNAGEAPAGEMLPRVAPRSVAPGLGGAPAVPVPRPSELPLTGGVPTLPVR